MWIHNTSIRKRDIFLVLQVREPSINTIEPNATSFIQLLLIVDTVTHESHGIDLNVCSVTVCL